MARHGGLGAAFTHARRRRLRANRTSFLLHVSGRASRSRRRQGRHTAQRRGRHQRAGEDGRPHQLPRRRLHQRGAPQVARRRLAWLLDRRGFGAAYGSCSHHHPRSGESPANRRRAACGGARFHRRQLHRQPDADGNGAAVGEGLGRVDPSFHLSSRFGRRRQAHARARAANEAAQHRSRSAARRPVERRRRAGGDHRRNRAGRGRAQRRLVRMAEKSREDRPQAWRAVHRRRAPAPARSSSRRVSWHVRPCAPAAATCRSRASGRRPPAARGRPRATRRCRAPFSISTRRCKKR